MSQIKSGVGFQLLMSYIDTDRRTLLVFYNFDKSGKVLCVLSTIELVKNNKIRKLS